MQQKVSPVIFPKRCFEAYVATATVLLACAFVQPTHAAQIYSTSFENPPFVVGPIAGQDGWSVFGPGVSTVENSFAKTGSQAVFVDGGTASQSGPFHSDALTGPLIDLSADIAIFASSTQSEWQFAGLGSGLSPFIGGIDIAPDNGLYAITAGFPLIGSFPKATAFDADAWHHLDLLFNFSTQTYTVTLDGSILASGVPFCGDNGPCAGGPVTSYGVGYFDSFGQSTFGSNPGSNDSGYMDNYSVSAVPEPSSSLLLGFGLVSLAVGARRKVRLGRIRAL